MSIPSQTNPKDQEQPKSLEEHFANAPFSSHGSRWNACWERNQTGWDRGQHSAALLEILTRGLLAQQVDSVHPSLPGGAAVSAAELFPGHPPTSSAQQSKPRTRARALVPGCGRGYDVLLLSSLGYDVVGVDLSPVGVQRAREFAEQSRRDGTYPIKFPGSGGGAAEPGTFQFVEGDFFSDSWLADVSGNGAEDDGDDTKGKFHLIFDYTFGCALPPSARGQWSSRYASLLAPSSSSAAAPGGRLVCLEFPSTKPPSAPGPPWAMPPDVYTTYLGPDGAGLKRLVHGKPTISHAAGMREEEGGDDGKKKSVVVDCISIWSH